MSFVVVVVVVVVFREFLKVFSSSGTEIFTRERCYEDHRGVVELQFGEGNFVTLHTQLYSRYSRLRLKFVVVRRNLHSGIPRTSFFLILSFFKKKKINQQTNVYRYVGQWPVDNAEIGR